MRQQPGHRDQPRSPHRETRCRSSKTRAAVSESHVARASASSSRFLVHDSSRSPLETRRSRSACVVNGRLATRRRGRRPARAAVCRIPCRILCLADVERVCYLARPGDAARRRERGRRRPGPHGAAAASALSVSASLTPPQPWVGARDVSPPVDAQPAARRWRSRRAALRTTRSSRLDGRARSRARSRQDARSRWPTPP